MLEEVVDLFGNRSGQLGFDLGDKSTPKSYEPNREDVRRELLEVLESDSKLFDMISYSCDTSYEELDGGDEEPCGCRGDGLLEVLGEAAIAV
jgi:hypothetical protein